MKWLKWEKGRQKSGYDKLLIATLSWPIPFDCYLLRFPTGSGIAPHTDPVRERQHYRFNWVIKKARQGGEFVCKQTLFRSKRCVLFRPDQTEHSVTTVTKGTRYVLSVGWTLKA